MTEPVKASEHRTPEGVSDETVEGVGKLSEGFEYIERARGHLYTFHQLMGRADFLVEEAADMLRVLGGEEPEVPLPDFEDAYKTQVVLEAIERAAAARQPVALSEIG